MNRLEYIIRAAMVLAMLVFGAALAVGLAALVLMGIDLIF